ncbi:MAG: methionine--tRNA ligase [Alphaproteobacteria bacterium]|nr:MAG: methionine--tRNA ligase [Alphaproteobacteria bacterium]
MTLKKRYLITSALPYINGIKHLGNLIGSMLPADVYARFLRQSGEEVLFVCGTDEHGTPAEIAADEAGKDIETYCKDMYETQKSIYEKFQLSFDTFGRSSDEKNHILTREIFLALQKNGLIEEKDIQQYYSKKDGRFLPDRYVMGECPKCGFQKARGDQCDGCGSLLDPTDLIHPYSSISLDKDLELRSSKHFFVKLEEMQDKVEKFVEDRPQWNAMTKGIAKKWLKEGLRNRCISRDLKWGIPIPGHEDKVFYVWFDAPNAYIAMTDDVEMWWKDGNVTYTQFMAKDNVPFHAVFWPGVLMGANQNWHLVDQLKSFGWLNYDGGKFSTSGKRGVFLDQALALYPSDYWRYYLLANIPETDDANFSFAHFAEIVNKDLADVLGNLINRVGTLVHKYFDGRIPVHRHPDLTSRHPEAQPKDLPETGSEGSFATFRLLAQDYKSALKNLQFRQAMQTLRKLWNFGNEFIAKNEPWALMKSDPQKGEAVLSQALYMIYQYAILSKPIIPDTSNRIMEMLGLPLEFDFDQELTIENWNIQKPEPLFKKVSDEDVEKHAQFFSGL